MNGVEFYRGSRSDRPMSRSHTERYYEIRERRHSEIYDKIGTRSHSERYDELGEIEISENYNKEGNAYTIYTGSNYRHAGVMNCDAGKQAAYKVNYLVVLTQSKIRLVLVFCIYV